MGDIKLTSLKEGQQNWGNAINTNFRLLYSKFQSSVQELQGLRDRLEELDTLQIQQDNFIYISGINKAYMIGVEDWDKPKSSLAPEFDPDGYNNYYAWFVQTPDNANTVYADFTWNTGDLLIIHKQVLGEGSVTFEQWKNIMGGYFEPISQEMDEEGKLITTYSKAPSFSTNDTTTINTPFIYWKPIGYQITETGTNPHTQLVFKPYQKSTNSKGVLQSTELKNMSNIGIDMMPIYWGTVYKVQATLKANETNNIIICNDFWSEFKGNTSYESIQVTAIFRDVSNNILYFPYCLNISNIESLQIDVSSGSFSGEVNIECIVHQDKTQIIESIINNIKG